MNRLRSTRAIYKVDFVDGVSDVMSGDVPYEWSGSVVKKLSEENYFAISSPSWTDHSVEPHRYLGLQSGSTTYCILQ